MGKDYYKTLGISKDASDADIKKAYKKMAMKWHPDRNPDHPETATKHFKDVSEAFEVLSDPNKKHVFDQYGEDGLKAGGGGMGNGASGGMGGRGGTGFPGGATFTGSHGGTGGGGMPPGMGGMGGGGFAPSDPMNLFSSFFGGAGGAQGFPGGFQSQGGPSPFGNSGGGFQMDTDSDENPFGGGGRPRPMGPATQIIKPLPVSLEDIYTGSVKKLKVTKKLINGGTEVNTLEVTIRPGYKSGTKFKFAGAGHETVTSTQDMVFVLEEKPHDRFKREGDDLVLEIQVPLVDALSGPTLPATFTRTVKMLDGRSVRYDIPYPSTANGGSPLKPGQVIKVIGEGMPISKKGSMKKKGDLIIRLSILFPNRLTSAQSTSLRSTLS